MASRDNSVTIVGNATRDPELRYTSSGKAVCTVGIAQNDRYFDESSKEWKDRPTKFFDVDYWEQQAENVAASVQKGDRVIVFGTLDYRTWETEGDAEKGEEPQKRSKVSIRGQDLGLSTKWATVKAERNVRSAPDGAPAIDDGDF